MKQLMQMLTAVSTHTVWWPCRTSRHLSETGL